MYARDAAEHFWPWYSNDPRRSPTSRASLEADGWTSTKSLPPVSPTRRGIGLVVAEIGSHGVPEMLEGVRRSGEVDAGERRMADGGLGDRGAGRGDHVDDPGWQSRRLEDLHDHLRGEQGGGRRLPDDGVADDRRCRREVAADRREVERADRQHEALERPVVHAVPRPGRRHRLHLLELLAEVHVPAPEVDQLARRVDLGLVDALALSEDGGRVEPVAEGTAQEVGGAEEHRGTRLPGRGRPVVVCGERRVDGARGRHRWWRSTPRRVSGCGGGARVTEIRSP